MDKKTIAEIAKDIAGYMLCLILFLSEDRYGSWAAQLQSLLSTLQRGPVRRTTHTHTMMDIIPADAVVVLKLSASYDDFYLFYHFYISIIPKNCMYCFIFTRMAFSCIWEMNHNAEILKTRFTKSVINSKVQDGHTETENINTPWNISAANGDKIFSSMVFANSCFLLFPLVPFPCWLRHLWRMLRPRWGSMTPARMMISPRAYEGSTN